MKKSLAAPHLALELVKLLGLDDFLKQHLPPGEEHVPWSLVSLILVICRLLHPSSELHIAEHFYKSTALCELRITNDKRTQFIIHNSPRDWTALSEGCYLLRTNITDWSAEDLWQASIQLTEAAFRIEKSDLRIRPIWHQKEERILAHILVCFLAYVLWKTLSLMVKNAGLGDEPRRVLEELGKIRLVDVVLPTSSGVEIRKRCITRPTEHQEILLQYLGLKISRRFKK